MYMCVYQLSRKSRPVFGKFAFGEVSAWLSGLTSTSCSASGLCFRPSSLPNRLDSVLYLAAGGSATGVSIFGYKTHNTIDSRNLNNNSDITPYVIINYSY